MSRTSFAHAILAIMVALFISESIGTIVNYVTLVNYEDSRYILASDTADPGYITSTGADTADPGYIPPNPDSGSGGLAPNPNVGDGGPIPNQNSGAGQGTTQLTNPLKSQTIEAFLGKIIDVLVVFALPIIVLFIMYAGFLYVTARGDTGKLETARSALLWAVVGGVIILGAKLISQVLLETVKTF